MRFLRLMLPLSATMTLAACAVDHPQTDAVLGEPGVLPLRAAVAGIGFQAHVDDQGAPGALAMALSWSGQQATPATLVRDLDGDHKQKAIDRLASGHGRVTYPVHDLRTLLTEVAAGNPVLILQEPSGRPTPVWRYALIVGYDLKKQALRVHSGAISNMLLPMHVFESNWERAGQWAVVVLPPDRQPASSAFDTVDLALAGGPSDDALLAAN